MQQPTKQNTDAGGPADSRDASGGQPVSASRAITFLMIGVVALAFTAPWVKLSNFEPATSAILRVGIALLFLIPFAHRERARRGALNMTGILLALLAGLFLGIDFTAWNYAVFYVGAGIASVLLNLQVIVLPALAIMFDGYRPPRSYFVLVPVMILGVALTGGVFDAAPNQGPATVYGIDIAILGTILGATSGLCYGIYLYASAKATRINPGRIFQPMVWASAAQLVAPALFMVLFSDRGFDLTHGVLINGELPMIPETTLGDPITGMNWFWMIVLATAGQAIAWTLIQYGSTRLAPSIVAGLLLLSPIATVFLIAWILFGEVPSALQTLGVFIVLAAVAYQNRLHVAVLNKLRSKKSAS